MTLVEPASLVLASASLHRAKLLEAAGVPFIVDPADLDERVLEAPFAGTGATAADIALVLAQAKAADVAQRNFTALVLGADQTLSLDDQLLHKVETMTDARRRLLALSGQQHHLHSAVVLMREGETIWRYSDTVGISLRKLTPEFIGRYLAAAGPGVLSSVGVYQVEGLGIQLIDKIDGNFFSVIGLPLLPLLEQLRNLGQIDG